jgi:hypothetical protein
LGEAERKHTIKQFNQKLAEETKSFSSSRCQQSFPRFAASSCEQTETVRLLQSWGFSSGSFTGDPVQQMTSTSCSPHLRRIGTLASPNETPQLSKPREARAVPKCSPKIYRTHQDFHDLRAISLRVTVVPPVHSIAGIEKP